MNLPANGHFRYCKRLQRAAARGDRPVRSPYAHLAPGARPPTVRVGGHHLARMSWRSLGVLVRAPSPWLCATGSALRMRMAVVLGRRASVLCWGVGELFDVEAEILELEAGCERATRAPFAAAQADTVEAEGERVAHWAAAVPRLGGRDRAPAVRPVLEQHGIGSRSGRGGESAVSGGDGQAGARLRDVSLCGWSSTSPATAGHNYPTMVGRAETDPAPSSPTRWGGGRLIRQYPGVSPGAVSRSFTEMPIDD